MNKDKANDILYGDKKNYSIIHILEAINYLYPHTFRNEIRKMGYKK